MSSEFKEPPNSPNPKLIRLARASPIHGVPNLHRTERIRRHHPWARHQKYTPPRGHVSMSLQVRANFDTDWTDMNSKVSGISPICSHISDLDLGHCEARLKLQALSHSSGISWGIFMVWQHVLSCWSNLCHWSVPLPWAGLGIPLQAKHLQGCRGEWLVSCTLMSESRVSKQKIVM